MTWPRALSLLLVLGCGTDGIPGDIARATTPLVPTTHDSAGVTIHEHPADALARMPIITLDSTPIAVIGGEALEDDVSRLRTLVLLSDGRLVGWDSESGALMVFGTDGSRLGSFGRKGEGPGEFRTVETLAVLPGDTIVASDWILGRATVVHPDSGIVRMETPPLRGDRQQFAISGMFTSGDWVIVPSGGRVVFSTGGGASDTNRQRVPVGAFEPGVGATRFDTLFTFVNDPPRPFKMMMRGEVQEGAGPGRYARFGFAAGWNGTVAVVENDAWRIEARDATGALRTAVSVAAPRRAITDSLRESVIEAQLADYRETLAKTPNATRFQSIEDVEYNARNGLWADSLPPFEAAVASSGPILWLTEPRFLGTEPTPVIAIDPAGRLVGRLFAPAAARVMGFGRDRVVLRTEDDDGIVRFEVFHLNLPN